MPVIVSMTVTKQSWQWDPEVFGGVGHPFYSQSPVSCVFWYPSTRNGNLRFPNDFPSSQNCCKTKYKFFLNVSSFPSVRKFSVNGKQSLIQRIKVIVIPLSTASIMWFSFHRQNFQFTNQLKNRKFWGKHVLMITNKRSIMAYRNLYKQTSSFI